MVRKNIEGPPAEPLALAFHPLTPGRWDDFALLFGPRGGCAGCWCMWWRERQGEAEANKQALHAIVEDGPPPGVLAYASPADGGEAQCIGWCAVAPRADYAGLTRSKILKPVDDQPVWSVTCFFIHKDWRRRGVSIGLLRAAADFARGQGAKLLEGYPHDPAKPQPAAFVWTGLAAAFAQAGFVEVARRSEHRPIMRLELAG